MSTASVSSPYYALAPSDTCIWKALNKSCCLGKIVFSVVAIIVLPLELIARLFANIGIIVCGLNSAVKVDEIAQKTAQTEPLKTETNFTTQMVSVPSFSSTGVDPIMHLPFQPEDKLIVINHIQFSAETLARYLVINQNDSVVLLESGSEITIWKNSTEYLALLNQLLPLIKDRDLIKGIQMRIEGYPLALALIQEFNQLFPDFSFLHLLECLYQKMQEASSMGASFMTDHQKEGFHAYYQLRNCLPEKIVTILFPFYAYHTGDPTCISSASRVLRGQIKRLALLDLVPGDPIFSQAALKYQIQPYIEHFEEKFLSPTSSPTITSQTHWAGTITSDQAKQYVIDMSISVTLRYITLHQGADIYDGFVLALIRAF